MSEQDNPHLKYLEADKRWKNLMLKIGRAESARFSADPDKYAEFLVTTEGARLLMRWIYHYMVCKKIILSIEEYSQEQKQEIWDFVLEKCKDKCQNKTKLIEVAKVFCVIDYFLNESNATTNR